MREKLGFSGTLLSALCCLGVSIVMAPLTAIGLGLIIIDLILLPLVLVFLLITLWGRHAQDIKGEIFGFPTCASDISYRV